MHDPAGPRRILVIDDSTLIREASKIALGAIGGHEVLTAADAEDGLSCAGAEHPDAILLDVVMPGMDGIAAARLLADTPATADIPIVLMTARAGDADRERYATLPVRGVVSKPFELTALAGDLAAILGWAA